MSGPGALVIGTRGSALARWQAAEIGRLLKAAHPGLAIVLNGGIVGLDQAAALAIEDELGRQTIFADGFRDGVAKFDDHQASRER